MPGPAHEPSLGEPSLAALGLNDLRLKVGGTIQMDGGDSALYIEDHFICLFELSDDGRCDLDFVRSFACNDVCEMVGIEVLGRDALTDVRCREVRVVPSDVDDTIMGII